MRVLRIIRHAGFCYVDSCVLSIGTKPDVSKTEHGVVKLAKLGLLMGDLLCRSVSRGVGTASITATATCSSSGASVQLSTESARRQTLHVHTVGG